MHNFEDAEGEGSISQSSFQNSAKDVKSILKESAKSLLKKGEKKLKNWLNQKVQSNFKNSDLSEWSKSSIRNQNEDLKEEIKYVRSFNNELGQSLSSVSFQNDTQINKSEKLRRNEVEKKEMRNQKKSRRTKLNDIFSDLKDKFKDLWKQNVDPIVTNVIYQIVIDAWDFYEKAVLKAYSDPINKNKLKLKALRNLCDKILHFSNEYIHAIFLYVKNHKKGRATEISVEILLFIILLRSNDKKYLSDRMFEVLKTRKIKRSLAQHLTSDFSNVMKGVLFGPLTKDLISNKSLKIDLRFKGGSEEIMEMVNEEYNINDLCLFHVRKGWDQLYKVLKELEDEQVRSIQLYPHEQEFKTEDESSALDQSWAYYLKYLQYVNVKEVYFHNFRLDSAMFSHFLKWARNAMSVVFVNWVITVHQCSCSNVLKDHFNEDITRYYLSFNQESFVDY